MATPSITARDVVSIARIYGVRVSPRGEVAYVVSRPDFDKNRYRVEVAIASSDGIQYFLEAQLVSMLAWSPSGSMLAFIGRRNVKEGEKGAGVYVWPGRGDPRLVAWFKHGVYEVKWAGDERLLVLADKPVMGDYDEDGDYVATSQMPLWFDGSGIIAGTKTILYSIDVDSSRIREEVEEDGSVRGFEIHDNDIFYYYAPDWRKPNIHRLVVKRRGETEVLAEDLTISQLYSHREGLYILAHRRPIGLASHFRLFNLSDEGIDCISCRIDRNIHAIAGTLEGDPLVIYADRGARPLAVVRGSKMETIAGERGYIHDAHSMAGLVAYIGEDPVTPPEVYTYRAGSIARITRINSWINSLGVRQTIHFTVGAEGDVVDAWVILPEGEGPHPAILYIHGGPKGMYGYRFHGEMQFMASNGFAVIYSNPRGSDGYSEEFADIRGRYGDVDYKQLMSVVDKAVREFNIDGSRLGVTGISYGGYMTNVIITKTSRFKAAVSENGIADWIADYWASDIGYWFNPDQIGGTPHDNLEEYIRRSPAYNVDDVETPVLIIHSMEDYRCFIDQALAMHLSLALKGKKSKLLVFKKGSHSHSITGEPRHRMKRLEAKLRWFKDHLGPNTS